MKFCCLLALIWSKPGVTYKFIRIQNLWQNAELGIYIFLIWETVSEWFIWHLNWPSVYNTTYDDGAILSISKGSSVEEARHQTWESRKTWDHIREAQMAASPKLAGDHEKITSSVHVNMDGRTLWPKSIGAQGKSTHSQAKLLVYARCKCRENDLVNWIFLLFWYFWRVCETVDEWRML